MVYIFKKNLLKKEKETGKTNNKHRGSLQASIFLNASFST